MSEFLIFDQIGIFRTMPVKGNRSGCWRAVGAAEELRGKQQESVKTGPAALALRDFLTAEATR